MKRLLLTLMLLCAGAVSFAQVNVITVDNKKSTTDPNEKFINGVSTKEDVGGVDVEIVNNYAECWYYCYLNTDRKEVNLGFKEKRGDFSVYDISNYSVKLTNYNSFAVTVYYEVSYDFMTEASLNSTGRRNEATYQKRVGTIVIPAATNGKYTTKTYTPEPKGAVTEIHFSHVVKRVR